MATTISQKVPARRSENANAEIAESVQHARQRPFSRELALKALVANSPVSRLGHYREWYQGDAARKAVLRTLYDQTVLWLEAEDRFLRRRFATALYNAAVVDRTSAASPLQRGEVVARMVARSVRDVPTMSRPNSLLDKRASSLPAMLSVAHERLATRYAALVSTAQGIMEDFVESGLGSRLSFVGPHVVDFEYSLNRLECEVVAEKSTETTERRETAGLFHIRTDATTTTTTTQSIESRSVRERHVRRLFHARRSPYPFRGVAVPRRVEPLVDSIPSFLRGQAFAFSASEYQARQDDEVLSRTIDDIERVSVDTKVSRRLDTEKIQRVSTEAGRAAGRAAGTAALVAGVGLVGLTVGVSSLFDALSAIPDPCIAVGPWVIAGWHPHEL